MLTSLKENKIIVKEFDVLKQNKDQVKDTIANIMKDLVEQEKHKRDFNVSMKNIVFTPDAKLTTRKALSLKSGIELEMTDWALSQVAQRLNVPVKYAKFLRNHNRLLLSKNFNEMKKTLFAINMLNPDKEMLLRTLLNNEKKPYILRGFLTENYSPFDNLELMEEMYDIINEYNMIPQIYRNELYFFMRLIVPYEFKIVRKNGKEDVLHLLFDIWNSEVGYSAVKIEAGLYRLVCSNGLMIQEEEFGYFSKIHRSISSLLFKQDVKMFIENTVANINKAIELFQEATKFEITNPEEEIEKIAKKYALPNIVAEKAKDAFLVEPMYDAYGIVNAFTRAAQDFDVERREELEKISYKILKELVV